MNQTDPLSELRDIHLPDPVSWWPPAPGWWFVVFLTLAVVVALIYFVRRRLQNNRYRKVALHKLSLLDRHNKDHAAALVEISALLRRVALQTYGRKTVAPLVGDPWLAFLDKTGKTTQFRNGAARVLGSDLYRPTIEADIEQVLHIAEKWIKEHRQC